MGEGRQVLTDDKWERVEDILPGRQGDPGVTAADSRLFPEAVPWRTRTGARWRDLPERFGKWNSVSRRFRRRVEGGVSGRVFQRMSGEFDLGYVRVDGTVMRAHRKAAGGKGASGQGLGRSRGGLTGRVLAMTDAPGYLVDIAIPAGQAHDLKGPGGPDFRGAGPVTTTYLTGSFPSPLRPGPYGPGMGFRDVEDAQALP